MGNNFRLSRRALGALAVLTLSGVAAAHHSFAMFDFAKVTTLRGTVKEFHWANPHVILWINAEVAGQPEPQVWYAELTSPGNLTRVGWNKRAFQAGDPVEIEIYPLRNGTKGGAFKKGTVLATGKVWTSDLRQQEKPGLE
jgi:Family of unknown function (DUF6152)